MIFFCCLTSSRQKTGWWINSLRLILILWNWHRAGRVYRKYFSLCTFCIFLWRLEWRVMADKWAKLLNIWLPGGLIDTLFIHLGPWPANTGSVRCCNTLIQTWSHMAKLSDSQHYYLLSTAWKNSPTDIVYDTFNLKWFRNEGLY